VERNRRARNNAWMVFAAVVGGVAAFCAQSKHLRLIHDSGEPIVIDECYCFYRLVYETRCCCGFWRDRRLSAPLRTTASNHSS
jgi:hypothetical protein